MLAIVEFAKAMAALLGLFVVGFFVFFVGEHFWMRAKLRTLAAAIQEGESCVRRLWRERSGNPEKSAEYVVCLVYHALVCECWFANWVRHRLSEAVPYLRANESDVAEVRRSLPRGFSELHPTKADREAIARIAARPLLDMGDRYSDSAAVTEGVREHERVERAVRDANRMVAEEVEHVNWMVTDARNHERKYRACKRGLQRILARLCAESGADWAPGAESDAILDSVMEQAHLAARM